MHRTPTRYRVRKISGVVISGLRASSNDSNHVISKISELKSPITLENFEFGLKPGLVF